MSGRQPGHGFFHYSPTRIHRSHRDLLADGYISADPPPEPSNITTVGLDPITTVGGDPITTVGP